MAKKPQPIIVVVAMVTPSIFALIGCEVEEMRGCKDFCVFQLLEVDEIKERSDMCKNPERLLEFCQKEEAIRRRDWNVIGEDERSMSALSK
jgi:hypothetical protein